MDGPRCPAAPECKKKCANLHVHLSSLPRDEQEECLHNLTGKQRSELAATISNTSLKVTRQRDKTQRDKNPALDADFNFLNRKSESLWGDVLRYSEVLDIMSQRRKAPVFTISKSSRFPPARQNSAAALLGPGHYPLDCDFPLDSSETQAGQLTRTRRVLGYTMALEERTADDGSLKGNSTTAGGKVPHGLAPGSYNTTHVAQFKQQVVSPKFSIPRAVRKGPVQEI